MLSRGRINNFFNIEQNLNETKLWVYFIGTLNCSRRNGLDDGVGGFFLLGGGGAELGAAQRELLGMVQQARTASSSNRSETRLIVNNNEDDEEKHHRYMELIVLDTCATNGEKWLSVVGKVNI